MDIPKIDLLICDVDGVLTDGRLTFDVGGEAVKAFHVRDGLALQRWRRAGGEAAILSGRASPIVAHRAAQLGVPWVEQGREDKLQAYETLLKKIGVDSRRTAFMGDDLPDLPPMRACGWAIAPADAASAVKRSAHYITRKPGGAGAVEEAVDLLLRYREK